MSVFEKWEPIAKEYNPLKAGSIDGTDTVPHDHAVIRAMQAEYKPNKLVVGDPRCTVFVAHLNPKTTEDAIEKAFLPCGEIKRLRLVRDVITGFSKRYAFIEYFDKYSAVKAQREMDKAVLDDSELFVDAECERTLSGWVPRRFGGGLSGKKESGQLRFGGKERPFKKPIVLPGKNFRKESREMGYDNNDHDFRYRDRRWSRDRYSESYSYKSRERDRWYHRDRESRNDNRHHSKHSNHRTHRSDRNNEKYFREKSEEREEEEI